MERVATYVTRRRSWSSLDLPNVFTTHKQRWSSSRPAKFFSLELLLISMCLVSIRAQRDLSPLAVAPPFHRVELLYMQLLVDVGIPNRTMTDGPACSFGSNRRARARSTTSSVMNDSVALPVVRAVDPSHTPRPLVRTPRESQVEVQLHVVVKPGSFTLLASLGVNFTANCITISLRRDKTLWIMADRWDLEHDGA